MRLFILQNEASNGHDFTVLFGNFDVNKLMHQSISAVTMHPPPSPKGKPWAFIIFCLGQQIPKGECQMSAMGMKKAGKILCPQSTMQPFSLIETVNQCHIQHSNKRFLFQLMSPFLALIKTSRAKTPLHDSYFSVTYLDLNSLLPW